MINIYKTSLSVCPVLLKPIIRILLKVGINYRQFSLIARKLFVDVALSEFGINGRKTNISRAAIVTGISRSEVTKLKNELEVVEELPTSSLSNASRLLTAWYTDPRYLSKTEEAAPLTLPYDSDDGPSFISLMKEYGGDIPVTSMIKELEKTSSIEVLDKNNINVLRRNYIPSNFDKEYVFRIGTVIADISNTLHSNLIREQNDQRYYEARATNVYISPDCVKDYHDFLNKKGQKFLEEVDEWLSEHEVKEASESIGMRRLGAGVYSISDS